ncbi:MAG TPA: DUF3566 domain-containing protein [Acidimicrobiales bacterium]|nr:DUF3566 domain-containing protein [Acidimicrobiales bacterium]
MPSHRLTLRSVGVRSVVRVSIVMYASMLLVFVVAWAILWTAAAVLGVTGNVEDFIAKLFALDSFHFSVIAQAIAIVIGGSVLIALGTGANALGATFYNLIVELQGGIDIDVETRDG